MVLADFTFTGASSLPHLVHSATIRLLPITLSLLHATTSLAILLTALAAALAWRLYRTSRRLAESRLFFQSIYDSMVEGVSILDCDKKVTQINRAGMRILGLADSTPPQHHFARTFDLLSPGGEPLPPEQWPSALAARGEFLCDREFLIRTKNADKTTLLQLSTSPIRNRHGVTRQILITYRDITESRRIDTTRQHLAALVESSEDAIIGKDTTGVVTTWNQGAEKIFGYTAAEMIGQTIHHLLPPGHEHEEDEILERILQGETVIHIDTLRQRKDSQIIHVSVAISPIRDLTGKIIGASKIARDITDKKLLEHQLHQSQKMEALGQLTGGIAHDFNNLLAIIMGNLELLELLTADSGAARKRIEIAQRAATRGAELTRHLLTFARKEPLHPAATALDASIQNIVEMAARALGPDIRIHTNFGAQVPPVTVDPAGLESALLNLAVNARDAMPMGGSLNIGTHLSYLDHDDAAVRAGEIKAGSYACISITDTGVGMSRHTLERVFEPFFTTKAPGKGTGLGLALVYGFAKQSAGLIRIFSELGFGTTVLLYLPHTEHLAPAALPSTTVLAPQHATPHATVLVVEDEPALLEIALAYLAQLGHIAYAARNAAEAMEIVNLHHPIDLLLTNIIMPGGQNGAELALTLRDRIPHLRVLYASGFTVEALAERNIALVDAPLLRKPFRRAEFESVVQQTLSEPDWQPQNTAPRKPLPGFPLRDPKAGHLSGPPRQSPAN